MGVDTKLVLKGIILLVSTCFFYFSHVFYSLKMTPNVLFWFFFILKIVDKALEEPKYSQLYAQLCQRLSEDAPNFEEPSNENPATQKQNTVRLFPWLYKVP